MSRRNAAQRPLPTGAATEAVPDSRVAIAITCMAAVALDGVAESLFFRDTLWGAHFFAFFPPAVLLAALPILTLLAPASAGWLPGAPAPAAQPARGLASRWLPFAAAGVAAVVFWLARERHLFWGDGLPLSINIPAGQRFHPNEPLTLFVHVLLFQAGRGHWSGATAVAVGSVIAGAVFVGWWVYWCLARFADPTVAGLAIGVLLLQGFTQMFYGHVENYTYLAVALLLFFTLGLDAMECRRHAVWPLLAGALAFAFHILGGLTVIPAAVLVAQGLRDRTRRAGVLVAVTIVAILLIAAAHSVAGLYDEHETPFLRLLTGVSMVLANPNDMHASTLLTARHLGDVWSEFMLLGPLSLPLVATLLVVLPGVAFARSWRGAFLITGAAALNGPVLLTGPQNMGWPRNWDLYAAPSVGLALCGILLVTAVPDTRQARRLLLALLAVSAFHTVPWLILNTDPGRTIARIAVLPMEQGRGQTMIGTHYLNAGDLHEAEAWFRKALARNPDNPNACSGLGLALARQGRWREAEGPMAAAVVLKPQTVQYRHDLVVLLIALEEWERAARELESVLVLVPFDRSAWVSLASCRMRLGQPDTASLVLAVSLGKLPGDAELEGLFGEACTAAFAAHAGRGNWSGAEESIRRLESIRPQDPRLPAMRASLAARQAPATEVPEARAP
jgi:tetratricopeptide (TPR) repeat protein